MYKKEKEYTKNLDLIPLWRYDIRTPISVINLLWENYKSTENPELISSIPRKL
ncbi:hypothetical protein [Clostridium sporogenes]|uniref:hypothetical protein n=1 Tax=Clostridium sporogenes TaxID=1509 RepID=UPI0022377221|nr:hypothetical protein [Clostridium sporogenes]MCW6110556.1 hypothetical protein [Clostridium sporogenes]